MVIVLNTTSLVANHWPRLHGNLESTWSTANAIGWGHTGGETTNHRRFDDSCGFRIDCAVGESVKAYTPS